MNEQKVLIIDRDSDVISTLSEYLGGELYDVFTARDGVAGFKILRRICDPKSEPFIRLIYAKGQS